jgi:hypothetical protein
LRGFCFAAFSFQVKRKSGGKRKAHWDNGAGLETVCPKYFFATFLT